MRRRIWEELLGIEKVTRQGIVGEPHYASLMGGEGVAHWRANELNSGRKY